MKKTRRRQQKRRRRRRRRTRRRRRKRGGTAALWALGMERKHQEDNILKYRRSLQRCVSDNSWVHDKNVKKCQINGCSNTFSFPFKKRHHCRSCGKVVCGPHSDPYKIQIFAFSIPSSSTNFSIRSCLECMTKEKQIINQITRIRIGNHYPPYQVVVAALRQAMMENITDAENYKCIDYQQNPTQINRKKCLQTFCNYHRFPNEREQKRAIEIIKKQQQNRIFYSDIDKKWSIDQNILKKPHKPKKKKKSRSGRASRRAAAHHMKRRATN